MNYSSGDFVGFVQRNSARARRLSADYMADAARCAAAGDARGAGHALRYAFEYDDWAEKDDASVRSYVRRLFVGVLGEAAE